MKAGKTDKVKLYVVKNDEGKYLKYNPGIGAGLLWDDWGGIHQNFITDDEGDASASADSYHGHVVELVEKPKPEVVSQKEAEMLKEAVEDDNFGASLISNYVYGHWDDYRSLNRTHIEDRLMRAYVNGWTVEKPKRYVLPMPGTDYHNIQMHGNAQYYAVKGTGNWRPDAIALGTDDAVKHGYTVTQADIDAAPDWVKAIIPAEVTDDD